MSLETILLELPSKRGSSYLTLRKLPSKSHPERWEIGYGHKIWVTGNTAIEAAIKLLAVINREDSNEVQPGK